MLRPPEEPSDIRGKLELAPSCTHSHSVMATNLASKRRQMRLERHRYQKKRTEMGYAGYRYSDGQAIVNMKA